MATILTQSEIDALLNSLNTGEDTGAAQETDKQDSEVRVYDFRTANKFSKEQIRTLHTIFDSFASLLSTRMTGLLRTLCEVSVISVEEQNFGEFNNSIPLPSLITIINAPPLKGSFIFQVSASIVFGIVGCLFGGSAEYSDLTRPFSEIDLAIMNNVLPQLLRAFGESWDKVAKISARLDRMETSPQFTQITDSNEPAAIITLNVKMGNVEDMITICMPYLLLQPISKRLTSMAWTMGERKDGSGQRDPALQMKVLDTPVTLRARLDKSQATIEDLLRMRVGDILLTGHSIEQCINVDIEQLPKFEAVLGVSNNRRVVQIAKIVKEREDIE